jgi:hypothetical protein
MLRLQRGYRRKIGDCVRLIDSTSVRLNGLSGDWATFSTDVCGAKAHIVYDPNADQPLYLMVTPANVNDITAAKEMPIEAHATYVFDLGYYDFGWWAMLDQAHCRIVTRLKANTPFRVAEEQPVAPGSGVLSDRTGYLPARMAASRRNPMGELVREVTVTTDTGKVLRIFTNDLDADAREIADLYKRRWAILPMGQTDLENRSLRRRLRECSAHSDHRRAHRLSAAASGSRGQSHRQKPACLRPADPSKFDAPASDRKAPRTGAPNARHSPSYIRF